MVANPAEETALVPVAPVEPASDGPYVTVMVNGTPMRFRADGLHDAIVQTTGLLHETFLGGGAQQPGMMRALMAVLKQAVGLLQPALAPMIEMARRDPRVPASVKRALPDVPALPRHADRLEFLMRYMGEVVYAALVSNAYALEIEPDETSVCADVMRVTFFAAGDPADVPHDVVSDSEPEE